MTFMEEWPNFYYSILLRELLGDTAVLLQAGNVKDESGISYYPLNKETIKDQLGSLKKDRDANWKVFPVA